MWRLWVRDPFSFSFLFLEVERLWRTLCWYPVEVLLRRIISQVINKMLKKQLPGAELQLGEVQANWSEKEQKLKIPYLVVDARDDQGAVDGIFSEKADAV